ncbi:MAG: hypothetical protein WC552_01190, partial [Candidatus Omnitrophota bacterium]
FLCSLEELYGLGYAHYQSVEQKINDATREDIRRIAREYLDLNKAVIVQVRPPKTEKGPP